MPSTRLAGAARRVTEPVRGYLNEHFEAVKGEVRDRTGDQTAELIDAISTAVQEALLPRIDAARDESAARAAQLIASVETLVDDQIRRVAALEASIAELQATNDQLLAVIAEFTMRPDGATTGATDSG